MLCTGDCDLKEISYTDPVLDTLTYWTFVSVLYARCVEFH